MPENRSQSDVDMENPENVRRQAESLLTNVFRSPIHLEVLEQFESNHSVLRCKVRFEGPDTPFPDTIIVKQRILDRTIKPDPFDQVVLFRNEWASLDFLASLSNGDVPGPHRIASDRQTGLVVIEDLGAVQSVQDVLYEADRQAATDALVGMGKVLGQIQGMSAGKEGQFLAIQKALEVNTPECDANLDCRSKLEELKSCLSVLELNISENFFQAVFDLESAIHGPGIWRTFVHNDAGPHNFVVTDRGVQLLDFEFSGYNHGMVDIVCARLGFPPAFRGRTLPREVVQQLEAAFFTELSRQVPEMANALDFPLVMSQASAHWALSKLLGFAPYLRERLLKGEAYDRRDGRDPRRGAFFRQQVFTYLRLTLASLEEGNHLHEIRQGLAQIVERLLQIWPETPLLDTYPAYGGEAWHYP